MELTRHPLIRKFLSLGLPLGDYVVAGSGPLLAHDLRKDIRDLDVVARGKAWQLAQECARPILSPLRAGPMVSIFDGAVEIFDRWLPGSPEPDAMIDGAEWVQGIPFCPLGHVRAWKERLGRPKDKADIELIDYFLKSAGQRGRAAGLDRPLG